MFRFLLQRDLCVHMIVHFLLQSSSRDYTFLILIIYVFACKHICSKLYLVDELVRVSARFEAWDNPCHLCSGFGMHTAYSIIYDHILPKRIIYDHIFQSYMFNFLKGVYSRGSSIMFCLRVPIFLNFFSKGVFFSQDFCGSCVHVNVYILQVIDINLVVVIHAVFLRIIYMWS